MKAPSSPRERHLLNVMSYMPKWLPFGILDKSQSINRSQYRDDGLVPTVCTGSSMFVMGLGRELNAPELAALFGHRDTPLVAKQMPVCSGFWEIPCTLLRLLVRKDLNVYFENPSCWFPAVFESCKVT